MICSMDPWHGLFAIAKFSAKEKARGQCQERKQSAAPSENDRISRDDTADAQFLNRLGSSFRFHRDLGKEIIGWGRRFIRNICAAQAIIINTGSLQENARAARSVLYSGNERPPGNDARVDEFLFLTFCPRPVFQTESR